jgi:hypothetical protein
VSEYPQRTINSVPEGRSPPDPERRSRGALSMFSFDRSSRSGEPIFQSVAPVASRGECALLGQRER